MSIQDNLKKMFTNEEQTVLWKTDIWGTIAMYLTCILCTRFCTSDLNVLFKTVLLQAGVAGFTEIPCEVRGILGEKDELRSRYRCGGSQAKEIWGAWAQRRKQGTLGSGSLSDAKGLIPARTFLNINFWLLNWEGTSFLPPCGHVCVGSMSALQWCTFYHQL